MTTLRPMRITYGVVWREGEGPLCRGKLELLPGALSLDGVTGSDSVVREIPYDELSTVRVGRADAERLDDRPTLVLDLVSGARLVIASVAQSGIAAELVERLARATPGSSLLKDRARRPGGDYLLARVNHPHAHG